MAFSYLKIKKKNVNNFVNTFDHHVWSDQMSRFKEDHQITSFASGH
jgi:hypothetical protein